MVRQMTPEQLQAIVLMRMEMRELQRQNTLLQRCLAQVSADQAAMWELLRVVGALKKVQKSLDTKRNNHVIL
jgi:hypothetical protein